MTECAHVRCHNVGPFGSRFFKGRGEWVPYKVCPECRAGFAADYQKAKELRCAGRKKPENRARQRELKKTPIAKKHAVAQRKLYAETVEGRAVIRACEEKRTNAIRNSTTLRLEVALSASIRGRLSGVRHGESVNIANYTDFVSSMDMATHFANEMKPGMTMANYGTFWSVAHKIPKVYYDFSDPEEIRRAYSKANLGCDYVHSVNPLHERSNSSKGGMLPTVEEVNAIDKACWPKLFGEEMNQEKRLLIGKHRW